MRLEIADLRKSFAGEPVLLGVSASLEPGRTLAVLGRSGSGKTTLLRIVAGLESTDAGSIRLGGRDITRLAPQQRGILYLSQEPLLFPHLSAAGNLAFGLRLRGVAGGERDRRVAAMLANLELEAHADKPPEQLSGGQRQRVAFGRALIVDPPLLLLDEPFGSLDVETRAAMQTLFRRVAATYGTTAVFVTHDLKEAILMGHAWAHLEGGLLRRFDDLAAFVADPAVGIQGEIAFWRGVAARAASGGSDAP